jgi:hypothetical protein
MASDREQAKSAIVSRDKDDPELDEVLNNAHQLQLELAREANRHAEEMRGWFGRLIGDDRNAPVFVALLAMMIGLGVWVYCLYNAGNLNQAQTEFWGRWAERSLAFAASALAYIFGKGVQRT